MVDDVAKSVLVQVEAHCFWRLALKFEDEVIETIDHKASHFGRGQCGTGKFVL